MSNNGNVGIIEGFYGRTWSWQTRHDYAQFLSDNGFSFYIYAPKADNYLRNRWRQDWPESEYLSLKNLAKQYQASGIDFGMALSPFELYKQWDDAAKSAFIKKIKQINEINPDILCILFDDMRGDFPNIAELQIDIVHLAQSNSTAKTTIMCPTYYSYEPVLEDLFGERPANYWSDLGQGLNDDIEIFWTGDKVCSTAYSAESLSAINHAFNRNISLWDNYPVNDGKKTSPFLHLRGFENRPAALSQCIKRHAVNPMNAAHLSQIPLMTLMDSYQLGDDYDVNHAQKQALEKCCGEKLASYILEDLPLFQDLGLTQLSLEHRQQLRHKYREFNTPFSKEICQWLDGFYEFDPSCLTG